MDDLQHGGPPVTKYYEIRYVVLFCPKTIACLFMFLLEYQSVNLAMKKEYAISVLNSSVSLIFALVVQPFCLFVRPIHHDPSFRLTGSFSTFLQAAISSWGCYISSPWFHG